MIYKTITFTCVALVGGSILLETHPHRDCNRRIGLCALSDAAYLPDEPAPEHAPPMIFTPPTASYTSSAASGPEMMYQFKITQSTEASAAVPIAYAGRFRRVHPTQLAAARKSSCIPRTRAGRRRQAAIR
jgi:hypothetical protein